MIKPLAELIKALLTTEYGQIFQFGGVFGKGRQDVRIHLSKFKNFTAIVNCNKCGTEMASILKATECEQVAILV